MAERTERSNLARIAQLARNVQRQVGVDQAAVLGISTTPRVLGQYKMPSGLTIRKDGALIYEMKEGRATGDEASALKYLLETMDDLSS